MINATSGISCTQNIRFTSGINAISGIKAILPESYQALYPFVSDFIDQVSNDYVAVYDNAPSFGGGGINTVANTNIKVTTFQKGGKGVYLDEPGTATVPCIASDRTEGSYTDGVSATRINFNEGGFGSVNGKYFNLAAAEFTNAIGCGSNGVTVKLTFIGSSILQWDVIRNPTQLSDEDAVRQGFGNDGSSSNAWTIDFSFSNYYPTETGVGSVAEVRGDAGDNVSGFPAALPWDTSGDFRFGYIGIGKTVADITAQVLLQTGNMGISTGIGITFAEIGASISSLVVTSDTIVGECFIKYVGGMLSIVIDGAESTPIASAAPVISGTAQCGANTSNLLPAPGTYGGLLFEVL